MVQLALGTAQFGMDYGINNKRGRIPKEEVFVLLDEALSNGIDLLDTAAAYGESEKIIGQYNRINQGKFKLITKVKAADKKSARAMIKKSLADLAVKKLYGCLIHDFKQNYDIYETLIEFKRKGTINKIGFSLYYPQELEVVLSKKIECDLVQFPCSIFDQRFLPYLKELKARQIETHCRSIFLQGLVFKQPAELDGQFAKIKNKVAQLNSLAQEHQLSILDLCLNFALSNKGIDRVVVGVDSLANLQETAAAVPRGTKIDSALIEKLKSFKINDQALLLPFLWPGGKH